MTLARPIVGIAFNASQPAAGRSNETLSETSVQETAAEVHALLAAAGMSAVLLPVQDDLLDLAARIQTAQCDLLINLCEAFRGIPQLEAHVAAFFEAMAWSFTGSGPATLALCQQKFASKAVLAAQGLPCAPGFLAQPGDALPEVELPVIVKPNAEDASLGIYSDSVILTRERLQPQVDKIWSDYHQAALVERYIDGREFNVAVLQQDTQLRALPVSEIRFDHMPAGMPHIVGYEAKWFETHPLYQATVPHCPAAIPLPLQETLQSLAVRAFKAMGCRDYARIDFRVSSAGEAFVLEVNPNPDISRSAGYARALRAAGCDYTEFWRIIIANAYGRGGQR
ncbi:MAG TPA: ATP-grasp domain-containing protein [bacterium]|nr:ATP-grasp domain-containing protein [bacterium]HPR86586.1 ATP-grasp domain-containing protein [bacterium]